MGLPLDRFAGDTDSEVGHTWIEQVIERLDSGGLRCSSTAAEPVPSFVREGVVKGLGAIWSDDACCHEGDACRCQVR